MLDATVLIATHESGAVAGDLISVEPFRGAVVNGATARLLVHSMTGTDGELTPATSVVFVPHGDTPADGWPVVAWTHGTTTGGQKLRAPSLSPTLDGGLTADGSVTRYVWVIETLIAAGYAVVAPDLEGLGAKATGPHPYFSTSSHGRSLVSAVRAAHLADSNLSARWAAVGHSEGGHGALAAEDYSDEAPELDFVGSVAFAPFTSVTAIVDYHGGQGAADPTTALDSAVQQNFNVALIAAGLLAQNPQFDLDSVMGADLRALMTSVLTRGSVEIVTDISDAISTASLADFSGFRPDWHSVPDVHRFLLSNDLAAMADFTLHKPALILQGAHDISVPDTVTSAFANRLIARGAPVVYRRHAAADHFTIVPQGMSEALLFLSNHLSSAEKESRP